MTDLATTIEPDNHLQLVPPPDANQGQRPPRFNYAGYCAMCCKLGCESPRCIEQHNRADWVICRSCDGSSLDATKEQLCDCLGGFVDLSDSSWVNRVVARPPRLNFAGWCLWCVERWCDDQRCIDRHQRSTWDVCALCNGVGSDDLTSTPCSCAYGLEQSS